jgi:hypothetical protein
MGVASNDAELIRFLNKATILSPRHPVVISKFLENAPPSLSITPAVKRPWGCAGECTPPRRRRVAL